MKRLFSFILVLVLSLSMVGCGDDTKKINQDYVKEVRAAADKLEATYSNYIVSNVLEAPDGTTTYIEVTHDGNNYTEYSVDKDGNYGTVEYGNSETITYALNDWLTKDGDFYLFGGDEKGNEITYSLPKGFTKYVEDRNVLYVNKFLDNLKGISKLNDMTLDLGVGVETFACYELVVDSETVKEVLGVSSYGIYHSLIEDEGKDSNIGKLCEYYLEDVNMCLTFSDANIIIGIDQNGILKYMCLETGGLGAKLYYTKAVVSTTNANVRDLPDFSKAVKYSTTMKDLADYVASYDTIEDAINSLNNQNNSSNNDIKVEDTTENTTESVDTTESEK